MNKLVSPLASVWGDDGIPCDSAPQRGPQLPEKTEGQALNGQQNGNEAQAVCRPCGPPYPHQSYSRYHGDTD